MARTTIKIRYTEPFNKVENIVKNILMQEGYREINQNNEIVWKKGSGFLTAMQYIKIEYSNNYVNVSGWVKTGMGNVGGNEMPLKGIFAFMPKKSVLKVISRLQNAVH